VNEPREVDTLDMMPDDPSIEEQRIDLAARLRDFADRMENGELDWLYVIAMPAGGCVVDDDLLAVGEGFGTLCDALEVAVKDLRLSVEMNEG